MPRRPTHDSTFAGALLAAQRSARLTLKALADRLQLSTKTVRRYIQSGVLPPVGRRHGIVYALRDLDPAVVETIIASLGLTREFATGAPRPPPDRGVAQGAAEAALVELLDRLDVGHVSGRRAVTRFLGRLAEARIDPAMARDLLAR